ncbi:hypothetical protein D3C87_1128820 [compost metagenome]
MHRQLVAVFRPFPAFRQIGQRFRILGIYLKERRGACQAFGKGDIDAAPALALAGNIVPALRPAAHHMAHGIAINAHTVRHVAGLVDQRFFRQAFLQRRQLAGLFEFLADPVRLAVIRQRLEFEDRVARHVIDLAFGRKLRRLGRRGGLEGIRIECDHRNTDPQCRDDTDLALK